MTSAPSSIPGRRDDEYHRDDEQMREVNEALLLSSVRQHELAEQARAAEAIVQSQKNFLEMLVRGEPLESLLDVLARSMESQLDSAIVAIHLMEPDGWHFGYVAAPSLPGQYADATRGMDARLELGCCSSAVVSLMPTIVRDFDAENRWPAFTADMRAIGLRSCFTTPILSREQKAVGTIAIYYREAREPSRHDQELVDVVAPTVALAVERTRADEVIAESEDRYRRIVDQVEDYAIFSTDIHGRATTWNEGVGRILGFDEHEFVGEEILDRIFTPEDIAGRVPEKALETAVREGVADNTRWMRRKNGERFFAVELTTALKGSAGELIGFTKVMRDITESHSLAVAQRESELRFRRLFESARVGILIVDAVSGTIMDANGFVAELLGVDTKEILGRQLHEIGMFRDAEQAGEAFSTLQRDQYARYEHIPLRRADGEVIEVEVIASVYHEAERPIAQYNIHDISERVAMQKRLAEQATQIADESRRKDEFLAMLSHELRNPLAPIRSAVHLIRMRERGSEDAITREAHQIIERQVANLTRLVSDLLEVSRVVSGRVRLDRQIVNLNQIAAQAVETTAPLFQERKHQLVMNLRSPDADSAGGVWIAADATRLEEVFINILNNAAKYTSDGGRIELRCDLDRRRNQAQLRVRDDGPGIDEQLLPHIFDLFTQADRSLVRSAGGLGIGLSLARRLVELHGGTIEAHSPPRGETVGSEFIVTLPLAPAPTPSGTVGIEPAETGPVEAAEKNAVRILLVDDNVDLVSMLEATLRHHGYVVRSAYDGVTGLEMARQWQPHVVLLDIGLPRLDGYEVARRIRATEGPDLKNTRLIALTGYGRDLDIAVAKDAGFDAHLTKPFEFPDLEKLMRA